MNENLLKYYRENLLGRNVRVASYTTKIIDVKPLTMNGKEHILVDTDTGFVCNVKLLAQSNSEIQSILTRVNNLREDSK